jgi:hypothetical protein
LLLHANNAELAIRGLREISRVRCCVHAAIWSLKRDFLYLPLVRRSTCFIMKSKEATMDTVNTRILAEHLTALATLLETEAVRLQVLGVEPRRDLGRQAQHIRQLAERLWLTEADIQLAGTMMAPVERNTRDRRKAPSVAARSAHHPVRPIKPATHLPDR